MLLLLALVILLLNAPLAGIVYAHGLGKETVGPKNVNDKLISLNVNLQPEIRDADKQVDITLRLDAIDEEGKSIKGTVYDIAVNKFADNKVFKERFHTTQDQDTLTIVFKPNADLTNASIVKGVYVSNMGYRSSDDQGIVIEGPLFLDAGLYILTIDLLAIDSNFLSEHVTYIAKLTIAEHKVWSISYEDIIGSIETISYFDKVRDLNIYKDSNGNYRIDAVSNFSWSKDFIKDVPLLHFEYYIPKGMDELAMRELKGYINNIEVPITVDRGAEDYVIVHYMIPNNKLLDLANKIPNDSKDKLIFSIVTGNLIEGLPSREDGGGAIDISKLTWSEPIQVKSSNNSFIVEVRYAPIEPSIDSPVVFKIKLYNANTMQEITSLRYDIMLYDSNGNHIDRTHRSVQTKDTQIYNINEPGTYKVVLANINKSGESASFTITVVPEFPVALLVMGVAVFASIMVRVLLMSNNNSSSSSSGSRM
jgi:hypothetical protein